MPGATLLSKRSSTSVTSFRRSLIGLAGKQPAQIRRVLEIPQDLVARSGMEETPQRLAHARHDRTEIVERRAVELGCRHHRAGKKRKEPDNVLVAGGLDLAK